MATPFGNLLRRYRLAAGLTQEELARRSRVSVRAISDLERGAKSSPRRYTLDALLDALALSPRERSELEVAARSRGAAARAAHPAPAGETDAPLVGRATERDLIDRQLTGAGPPLLVFSAPAGMGKTRLLREAAARASGHGLRVLEGGCSRVGGQQPLAPVLGALERDIEGRSAVELRAALAGCAWLVRLLPELRDGPIEPLPEAEFTPAQERRLAFRAVSRYLEQGAGPAGTLLVLDDLQWAGADALELLGELARSSREPPLRVVAAYREEETRAGDELSLLLADLAGSRLVAHRTLPPLEPDEAGQLLETILDEGAERAVHERLVERAGGVPFFLVSCAEAIGHGEAPAGIPWDIAESVRQRLAGLPLEAQDVLRAAAVVGRTVPTRVMANALGRAEEDVLAALDAACRLRLLTEYDEETYSFGHELIREVLESDLSLPRRTFLHRRIADALERPATAAAQPVEALAYHRTRSGDPASATEYLTRAAENARAAGAHREAHALLGQAIEHAGAAARPRLLARRGTIAFELGLWDEARTDLEAAVAALEDEEARAEVLAELAHVCHWLSDVPSSRRHADEALRIAERRGRDDIAAEAVSALALADSSDGLLEQSLARHRHAVALAGRRRGSLVASLELNSLILHWLGQDEDAVRGAQEAVALATEVDDVTYVARALGNLGTALTGTGSYADATVVFEQAKRVSREHRADQWLARSLAMEGGLHLEVFDFARAEELALEAREISRTAGWPLAAVSAAIDLVLNRARRGEPGGDADRLVDEAVAGAAEASGAHAWLWQLRLAQARAELAAAQEDWERAETLARTASSLAAARGRVKYEVAGLETGARALARLGRTQEALAQLRRAVARTQATTDPAVRLRPLGLLLVLDGDDQLEREARGLAQTMAAGLPSEPLRERLLARVEQGLRGE